MILSSSQLCSYISLPVCESRCDKKRAHTSLIKKGPKNFDDLLQQTRKYINLEEAVKMKKGETSGKVEKLGEADKENRETDSQARSA